MHNVMSLAVESGVCPSLYPAKGGPRQQVLGSRTPLPPRCRFLAAHFGLSWAALALLGWRCVGVEGTDELSALRAERLLPAQPEGIEGAGPPRSWAEPLKTRRGFPWLGPKGKGLPRADPSLPCGQLCCTSKGRGRIWPFPAEEDDVAWCLFPRSCRGNAAVLRLFVWVLLPGGVRRIARSRQWHQLPMHPRWRRE